MKLLIISDIISKFTFILLKFSKKYRLVLIFVFFLITTILIFHNISFNIDRTLPGGDGMFNSWTINRNIHCLLGQNCDIYTNANIFFPNKDSMLYSETQLSMTIIALPFYLINNNPIFIYNATTLVTFLFSGIFMYLLIYYLTKNNIISIIFSLYFTYSPYKIVGLAHLQNQSIFVLPLIILILFKSLETKKVIYYIILFLLLVFQFNSSWYQMIFALIVIIVSLGGSFLFKTIKHSLKSIFVILLIVLASLTTILPLAKEYFRFSNETKTTFDINAMIFFSADIKDYLIPNSSGIIGNSLINRFDSDLSNLNRYPGLFPGFLIYLIVSFALIISLIRFTILKLKKKNAISLTLNTSTKYILLFSILSIIGFILSLGPAFKFNGQYLFSFDNSLPKSIIILPYMLIVKILPSLSFIRAISRYYVITSFGLTILSALIVSKFITRFKINLKRIIVYSFLIIFTFLDILPLAYSWHDLVTINKIPTVYTYIKDSKEINNLIELPSSYELGFQQVMFAGYHNKNIFNGYSGISPKDYYTKLHLYSSDFSTQSISELKEQNIKYILTPIKSNTIDPVKFPSLKNIYQDDEHRIFEIL